MCALCFRASAGGMVMKKTYVAIASTVALFLALMAATQVRASTIYNNIGSSTMDEDPVSSLGPLADSFSTGSSGFSLEQVAVDLLATTPADGGSLSVLLLSDSSTSPGPVLDAIGALDDASLSTSLADYTLTLATPYTLAPDTRYWIELSSSTSSAEWAWSVDSTAQGVAGEYVASSFGVFSNIFGPYQMELSGTVIPTSAPEPSTLLLIGVGLLGLAWLYRREKLVARRQPVSL